jgi:putative DNA primase/helicase
MEHSDWTEVPNLWGLAIQRPAAKKSPSMAAALQPLHALEDAANESYDHAQSEYAIEKQFRALQEKANGAKVQKLLKSSDPQKRSDAMAILQEAAENELAAPLPTRYLVNDTTVEKLADLQQQNPALLVYRDEAQGFFASLERQGQEAARAYYLEASSGLRPFKVDRIGRGSTRIPRACVSILGSIQPGPLKALLRELNNRQRANDGLMQRFQLAVWPDLSDKFRLIDKPADSNADVVALFERMANLDPDSVGADCDDGMPYLRFDPEAQAIFNRWLEDHENRLRSDELAECMESHLGKYQGMVPSIALVLHLAEYGRGPVSAESLTRAIAWAAYLEAHAKRIYAPIVGTDFVSAKALAKKIKNRSLPDTFSIKDVYRPGWSNLGSSDLAWQAVEILEDFDWLIREQKETSGRPRTVFHVNPLLRDES